SRNLSRPFKFAEQTEIRSGPPWIHQKNFFDLPRNVSTWHGSHASPKTGPSGMIWRNAGFGAPNRSTARVCKPTAMAPPSVTAKRTQRGPIAASAGRAADALRMRPNGTGAREDVHANDIGDRLTMRRTSLWARR